MNLLTYFSVLIGISSYAYNQNIDFQNDSESEISEKLTQAFKGKLDDLGESDVICAPALKGKYSYSNGDDLDVTVDLEHVRVEEIQSPALKIRLDSENGQLLYLIDVAAAKIVADYTLNGNYYGEDKTDVTGTVTKSVETLHVKFTETANFEDGKVVIHNFEATEYSTQTFETVWDIEDDSRFGDYVSYHEDGFSDTDALDVLNDIVSNTFGDNGIILDYQNLFADLIKDKSAANEC